MKSRTRKTCVQKNKCMERSRVYPCIWYKEKAVSNSSVTQESKDTYHKTG